MGKYCSAPGSAVSAQTHCTASQGADGENRHRTHNGHKTCLPVSLPLHHSSCKDRGHLTFSNCPHLSTAGSAYTQSLSNPNFRLIFAPSSRIRMRNLPPRDLGSPLVNRLSQCWLPQSSWRPHFLDQECQSLSAWGTS